MQVAVLGVDEELGAEEAQGEGDEGVAEGLVVDRLSFTKTPQVKNQKDHSFGGWQSLLLFA